jgi:hypothetical protein
LGAKNETMKAMAGSELYRIRFISSFVGVGMTE